jgi:hypothetical protein
MGEATQGWTNLDPETVMNPIYLDAVRLLLDVAPAVFRNPLFALKGGTEAKKAKTKHSGELIGCGDRRATSAGFV